MKTYMHYCINPDCNILNVYWGTKCLEKEAVEKSEIHIWSHFSVSFVVYNINKTDTMHTFPSLCVNSKACALHRTLLVCIGRELHRNLP